MIITFVYILKFQIKKKNIKIVASIILGGSILFGFVLFSIVKASEFDNCIRSVYNLYEIFIKIILFCFKSISNTKKCNKHAIELTPK